MSIPAGVPVDPIAKLDGLPERFEPRIRTPTVALYKYQRPPAGGPDR